MKILIIQPWVSWRGAETVSVLEAYYLNKLGHTASIVCLYVDRDRLPPHGDEVGYILPAKLVSSLFRKSKLFFYLFNIPCLFWLVYKNSKKADILNPHNLPSPWIAALVKQFKNVKIVLTVHGVPPEAGFAKSKINIFLWNLGLKYLDIWAVRKADFIFSVSEKISKKLLNRYNVRSSVLYPPIEYEIYSGGSGDAVRKRLGIAEEAFVLLHVSELNPVKRPDLSLRVLAAVKNKIKKVVLVFVGSDNNKAWISNLADTQGVSDRVFFSGYASPCSLKDYFAASDLVLTPYWKSEGCPVVPLQALMAHKMSIVAYGSGVDEIIGRENLGIVVRPDANDFAKAVLFYYKNRQRFSRRIAAGKKYVEENFSSRRYVENIISILKSG